MSEPASRTLHRHAISASAGEPRDLVSPADFDLVFEALLAPEQMPPAAIAYCADFASERLLYTVLPEHLLAQALNAAFLYSAQLQLAGSVVSVPFERLADMNLPADPAPVLIFSPGRTGSTLLSRLLNAVGRRCASEPDFPTQFACLDEPGRARLGEALERQVLRAGLCSLVSVLGQGACIKLRSQCNARPDLLLAALPKARPVFMFRRHAAWAMSRHRAFGEPPDMVADILRTAVVAVDRLTAAGRPPKIVWFEDLLRDPAAFLADLLQDRRLMQASMRPLVAAVLARDSQAGTSLDRDAVRSRDIDQAFLAGFDAEWAERRPTHHLGSRLAGLLARLEQPGPDEAADAAPI
jgi:hypothetical protein